jgi:hypothetical protein
LLFVLQNAWRRNLKQKRWTGKGWEKALWASQTGKRLREYIPEGCEFAVINSTPLSAEDIGTTFPPDVEYVKKHVASYSPGLVILLGKRAAKLGDEAGGVKTLCFPHPCYRALTKEKTKEYKESIKKELQCKTRKH